jgi:pimeloyl-ACP methyl ester carboxylesterase/ketosteroid isomerase-like protein
MAFYDSDGLKLYYEEQGRGEPLVLVHGFGQNRSAWEDVVDAYARYFRVIVVELRGAGESDVPEPGYSVRDHMVADMVSLMDSLKVERVHFSGFSLGGAIGMELAIAHPDRLISLTLNSTWQGGPCPHLVRWTEIRKRQIIQNDPIVNVGTRMFNFFSPEFIDEHEDRLEAFIERERKFPPTTPEGIEGHAQACQSFDARDRLGEISTPTLITVGTGDRTTTPGQARYLRDHIPGSELIFIDGPGHATMFQCPREFTTVSLGFLLKHQSTRSDPIEPGKQADWDAGEGAILDLVENASGAFNSRDVDAIVDLFTEDAEWYLARGPEACGRLVKGRAAIRELLASRYARFPDMRWVHKGAWASGNAAFSTWTVQGKAADGEIINWWGIDYWEFADAKITRKDTYWKYVERDDPERDF